MTLLALAKRLRRTLTVRLVVALGTAIVAALLFTEIAEEVLEGEATPVDRSISLWLHQFDSPVLDVTMRAFTFLGSGWVLVVVVALIAAWAVWRKQRRLAGLLVSVALAAELLNVILKLLFERTRPDLFFEILSPKSYSFPSGHAMASTAVYGMVAVVLAQLHPRLRWLFYLAAPVLVFLIGVSRVFLGVHWPTDVAGGFAAGGAFVAAGALVLSRDRHSTGSGGEQ